MIVQEVLDGMVHDTASQVASTVNNDGVSHQMEYLLANGWTQEEIDARLREKGAMP
jgi:YD repeat-containing protein